MKTFFTSDLHLGHANIIKYCNRPFKSLEHMNKELIRRWNERVKPEDFVYHIGDFCFCNTSNKGEGIKKKAQYWINQLNGNKIFFKGNHDCFSKETRLLTKDGYKYYWEVKKGDLIPTIDLEKKCVEFQPIKGIVTNNVNKAYVFKTKTAEGSFSDNHNHLYSFGTSKNKPIKEGLSDKIWNLKSPIKFLSSFQSGLLDYDIDKDLLLLLAWIITDGGIEKKYKYITIYQSKEYNINYLKKLLNRLNISYTLNTRQRKTTQICGTILKNKPKLAYEFKILAESSRYILKKLNLDNKTILPQWMWNLSDKQVKMFINEVIRGDGTLNAVGTGSIYGKRKILEHLLGLCVTHGIRSNLVKDIRGDYYLTISNGTHNKEFFTYKTIYPKKRKIIDYNDIMWCVNVPNHTLFIELNGKTLITKNSNNSLKTKIHNAVVNFGNIDYFLTHKPIHYNKKYPINLVGHVHEKWKIRKTEDNIILVNVGVDVWNFHPIIMDEILHRIKQHNNEFKTILFED